MASAGLEKALDEAGVRGRSSDAAISACRARIDGLEAALAILALFSL
jgi:hypothetical protein